jgi:hypothetical protein
MFIEVSGRFQELLRMFPTEAWLANRNPSGSLQDIGGFRGKPLVGRALHVVAGMT